MKKYRRNIALMTVTVLVFTAGTKPVFAVANYVNNYIPDKQRDTKVVDDCSVQDSSSSGQASDVEDGATGLSNPKVRAYAEQMITTLKTYGLSGACIAGIIANALSESSDLNPMRAESSTSAPVYFSSPTDTNPPEGMNIADAGGGGGIYQITPYTKFVKSPMWSDKKFGGGTGGWTVDGETVYMMEYGLSEAYLGNSRGGMYAGSGGLVDSSVNTKEKFFQAENSIQGARNASGAWEIAAEGPLVYSTARLDLAVVVYNELKLSSVKADPEKIKAYLNGGSDSGSSGGTSDTSDETPVNNCQADSGSSDSNIVNYSKSILGYFTYGQVHGVSNIGSVANPSRSGVTDCSGFVWLALAHLGYKVPEDMQWYTGSMESDAKGAHEYLKEIKPSEAGAGDIVIVNTQDSTGDSGHTAILTDKWEDKPDQSNQTPIIQEGGEGGGGGVNEGHFADSFSVLLNGQYGSYTITFARPVSEAGSQKS